jgi:micrococcal nuclease
MDATTRLAVAAVVVLAGCSGLAVTDTPTSGGLPGDTPGTGDAVTPAAGVTPAGGTAGSSLGAFEPAETVDVTVTRVVDGDTVDVRFPDGTADTVRLVGIDTPEVHVENDPGEFEGVPDTRAGATCLREAGHDATAYAAARIEGANVTLAFDSRTDRRGGYDRLLAYVHVEDSNLNHELVAAGHARVYETDFALRDAFEASAAEARAGDRGLWACR